MPHFMLKAFEWAQFINASNVLDKISHCRVFRHITLALNYFAIRISCKHTPLTLLCFTLKKFATILQLLNSVSPVGAGGSVLVMPPPLWCLQILTVDSTHVNVERHYPLRCWFGTGDCCYACLHHVLSVRAFKLCQSSEESVEERLMTLDSSPSPAANLLGTSMRQIFSVLVLF